MQHILPIKNSVRVCRFKVIEAQAANKNSSVNGVAHCHPNKYPASNIGPVVPQEWPLARTWKTALNSARIHPEKK